MMAQRGATRAAALLLLAAAAARGESVVTVSHVESLDDYFTDKPSGDAVRVPYLPTYLPGDGLRLRFHGSGFFPTIGVTIQDVRTNSTTVNTTANATANVTTNGTNFCETVRRDNASEAADPTVDIEEGTGMVVTPDAIDWNGTWFDVTLRYDYHFNSTSQGFGFCLSWTNETWALNATNGTNATNLTLTGTGTATATATVTNTSLDANATNSSVLVCNNYTLSNGSNITNCTSNATVTASEAVEVFNYTAPETYNFTVWSGVYFQVYSVHDVAIDGSTGPDFTVPLGDLSKTAVLNTTLSWTEEADGTSEAVYQGRLYAALSVYQRCGEIYVPPGWGTQAAAVYADPAGVYYVEEPLIIYGNETDTSLQYMAMDTPEMYRVYGIHDATTFYLCVKAHEDETSFFPLVTTEHGAVTITLDFDMPSATHLGETLTPHTNFSVGYSVPPPTVLERSDYETVRMLKGRAYTVPFAHTGLRPWMKAALRPWCGEHELTGLYADETGYSDLSIDIIDDINATITVNATSTFDGYMLCLSRVGNLTAEPDYSYFTGYQYTSVAITGIGAENALQYNFSSVTSGKQLIYTSSGEAGYMRMKFEGGDGAAEESGDEYTGADPCTQDTDGEHEAVAVYSRIQKAAIPTYAMPTGGADNANASVFNMSTTVSTAWRVNVALCVTLYPWVSSTYFRVDDAVVGFVTQFTSINYTAVEYEHPTRGVYLYRGHATQIGFRGGGLFADSRMALGLGGVHTPCQINMDGLYAHEKTITFDGVLEDNDVAWWMTPDEWIEDNIDAVICLAKTPEDATNDDYRFNTRWQFKVMQLVTISRGTHLDLTYGVTGDVYALSYINGEIGNHLAMLPHCENVTRDCGGDAVNGGYCSSPDPFQQAAIGGCARDPLGMPGGQNDRLTVASNVPPPGNILFLYNCQTAQHTHTPLKVCYAPFLNGVFSDTGLTVSIKIQVPSMEIDGQPIYGTDASPGLLNVLRRKTPTVKLVGAGLYSYMRVAVMPECGVLPDGDVEAEDANVTHIMLTRPWRFVVGSDTTRFEELQFTPSAGNTEEVITGWKFCLSQYGDGTQEPYASDFSIELPYRLNVVDFTAINATTTHSFAYGDRMPLVLTGQNLYRGMYVKFARACSDVAPESEVCSGNFGVARSEGGSGCNVLSDTLCYHVPDTGLQVDEDASKLWFFMFQSQSSQLADDVKVCVSLYPNYDVFHDTGLAVDFVIKTTTATLHGQLVKPYETLLLYKGFNDFLFEEWPASDPRAGRVAEIHVKGQGFRDFYRVKFQAECGEEDPAVSGPPVPLIPYTDPNGLDEQSCGIGDRQAYLYLTADHLSAATPENLRLCYSTAGRGTNFFGQSTMYLGIVELADVASTDGSLGSHIDLSYGFIGGVSFHGASLMPYMKVRFAQESADGVCFPPGISSFDSSLSFSELEGTDTRYLPNDYPCLTRAANGECKAVNSPSSPSNTMGVVSLKHLHTFRHMEGLKVCLSLWGGADRYYDTGLTLTTGVFVTSVESYNRQHDGQPGFDHVFVYTKYPEHVITLHGRGFYDHHRVVFTKDECGPELEGLGTAPKTEVYGPFPIMPVSLPERTSLPTLATEAGQLRTTALIEFVVPNNLEDLNMCFSVYAGNDDTYNKHFSLPMNVQLFSIDVAVEKYYSVKRSVDDPIVFNYGATGRVTFAKAGLPIPGADDTFMFQINSECGEANVTVGVITPAMMVFVPVRDRVTNLMIEDVPAVTFASSMTRQYAHQKLCFSPYPPPHHHFMETGYQIYVECADSAQSCADATAGICDANATKYHQIVKGCDCAFSQRSNFSCSLGTNVKCSAETTCSGHGECNDQDLCECDSSYYGPGCEYCDVGVRNIEYTQSLKHLIVHFSQGYTHPDLAVASMEVTNTCEHLIPLRHRQYMADPVCYWEAPDRLHIMMGHGGRLAERVLTLDTEAISTKCDGSNGGVSPLIIPQTIPPALIVPYLLIPDEITVCDEVVLDGSLSWTSGGEMEYHFALRQGAEYAYSGTFDNYLKAKADKSFPTLRVATQYIPMGTYQVVLTVKNIRSGTNASTTQILRKEQETVPPSLVVTIPQVTPFVIDATDQSLQVGPVETTSYMFSNIPNTCFNLDMSPQALARRGLRYKWELWWRTHEGDMYYDELGRGWRENTVGGQWRRSYLPAESDGYQTLFLRLWRDTGSGMVESFLANRTAEVRVSVELYETPVVEDGEPEPEPVVAAVGRAALQIKRFQTPIAYIEASNRTVSTSFTLKLVVRVGSYVLSGAEDIYATQWWCNDTSALTGITTGTNEVPCPEPLRQVANVTSGGLAFPIQQGRTRFSFGGDGDATRVPPGRYLFTVQIYVPSIKAHATAVAEIIVREPVMAVEFMDVGIEPSNASVHYQHVGCDREFALTHRMLSPVPREVSYTYLWSVWAGRHRVQLPAVADAAAPMLRVPPGVLRAGGTYEVKLLVREMSMRRPGLILRQAQPQFKLYIWSPPHGGQLRLAERDDGVTVLIAEGWVIEPSRYPLRYLFSNELFCGNTGACSCCNAGKPVSHPAGSECETRCAQCICTLLSDFTLRNYLPVTLPRTPEETIVEYQVKVLDRYGVAASYTLPVPTIATEGVEAGLPPPPYGPADLAGQIDSTGLTNLNDALTTRNVAPFLQSMAEVVTGMRLEQGEQYATVECPDGSDNPEGDGCVTLYPREEEIPLLPTFPKDNAKTFQVQELVRMSTDMLESVASAEEKQRLLGLSLSAVRQPSFVSRGGADSVITYAQDMVSKTPHLNTGEGFYQQVATLLARVVAATENIFPDHIRPDSMAARFVTTATKDAIRQQKKLQIRRVKETLDMMRLRLASDMAVNESWTLAAEGLSLVCQRVPTALPQQQNYTAPAQVIFASGAEAGMATPAPVQQIAAAPALYIPPGESVFPESSLQTCDEATGECTTTLLGMSYLSSTGLLPAAANTDTTSCIETYPNNIRDYGTGAENITGTSVVGYTLYDNGTERAFNDLGNVIVKLPMDKHLYKTVKESRKPNELLPACYWFDPETPCETATNQEACDSMCCQDIFENRRLFTCRFCCRWDDNSGTCRAGERGGRGTFRTDGCYVESYTEESIFCNCTHLTDFVQGFIESIYVQIGSKVAVPAPDRASALLPTIPSVTPPNIASVPQVLVLPVVFAALSLIVMWREEAFRRAIEFSELGKHATLPWETPLATADKQYMRTKDDETGHTAYIRKLDLLNLRDEQGVLAKLLALLMSRHIYLELIFYRIEDNVMAVHKVLALCTSLSCCWAVSAELFINMHDNNISFRKTVLYAFAISAMIGPISWILRALYGKFERSGAGLAVGEYLRKAWIVHRTKARVTHARLKQDAPLANPEFYAPGQMPDDEGEDMAILNGDANKQSPGHTATALAGMRSMMSGGTTEKERRDWEVDCVVDATDAWAPDEEVNRVLGNVPEPLAQSIQIGSSGIDPDSESSASEDEEAKYRGLVLRKKMVPTHYADKKGPTADNDAVDEGSILSQPRLVLRQACYDVKCGRFLIAIHLLYELYRYTHIQKGADTEDLHGLMEKAMRKVGKLAMQIFNFTPRDFQVALAYEERRTVRWWDGVQSIAREGGALLGAAQAFLKHLQNDPLIKKWDLAERAGNVKGWCYYYFIRGGHTRNHFDDAWSAVINTPMHDADARDEYEQYEVPLSVEYATLGLPDGKLFTREDVIGAIIAGKYVKAEFMVNRLEEGETVGNLRATAVPGEFEMNGDISDDVTTFARDNDEMMTNSRFWVLYIAFLAQGVAKFTFDKEYSVQLRQLLRRRQRVALRQDDTIEHIPTKLREESAAAEGEWEEDWEEEVEEYEEWEEWEEVEEEEEEEEEHSRSNATGSHEVASSYAGSLQRVHLKPKRSLVSIRSMRSGLGFKTAAAKDNDDRPPVFRTQPLSHFFLDEDAFKQKLQSDFDTFKAMAALEENPERIEEDKGPTRGKATALKLVKTPIEVTYWVRPVPAGFRSRGDFSNRLGIGTEDSPYCSLEYCMKMLRVRGYPTCRVVLLGGVHPPMTLKGAKNCEIVAKGGNDRVQVRGRKEWEPVIVLDSCRNLKLTGLEISHGTVGVDASTSTDVFIYDNVMSDVQTGVINPTIACLGDTSQDIDFNFCNFILQRPQQVKEFYPAAFAAILTAFCFLVAVGTYVSTTITMFDMTKRQLAYHCAACYIAVLWDILVWQLVMLYLTTHVVNEKAMSQDTRHALLEKGARPGYPIPWTDEQE